MDEKFLIKWYTFQRKYWTLLNRRIQYSEAIEPLVLEIRATLYESVKVRKCENGKIRGNKGKGSYS